MLQGFPDDFEVVGTRRSVQLQIGNSVLPPVARVIASAVRDQLEGRSRPGLSQVQLAFAQTL
jgi:site-specific DNA-cytosine methylase